MYTIFKTILKCKYIKILKKTHKIVDSQCFCICAYSCAFLLGDNFIQRNGVLSCLSFFKHVVFSMALTIVSFFLVNNRQPGRKIIKFAECHSWFAPCKACQDDYLILL